MQPGGGQTFNYTYTYTNAEGNSVSNTLQYTFNEDGTTVSVAEQGKDAVSGDVVIPGTVEYKGKSYSVTSIGECAFQSCSKLTSVTFDKNSQLTGIGNYAFAYCSALTNVTIPSSVTSIGICAFYKCSKLESVTIPSSVTSIGIYAFNSCSSLTSVDFADNSKLTSIGDNAFENCSTLKSVAFAENSKLASIGGSAFYDTGLTSIVIPEGVTTIGEYVFGSCDALQTVTIPASVTSVANLLTSVNRLNKKTAKNYCQVQ